MRDKPAACRIEEVADAPLAAHQDWESCRGFLKSPPRDVRLPREQKRAFLKTQASRCLNAAFRLAITSTATRPGKSFFINVGRN